MNHSGCGKNIDSADYVFRYGITKLIKRKTKQNKKIDGVNVANFNLGMNSSSRLFLPMVPTMMIKDIVIIVEVRFKKKKEEERSWCLCFTMIFRWINQEYKSFKLIQSLLRNILLNIIVVNRQAYWIKKKSSGQWFILTQQSMRKIMVNPFTCLFSLLWST